MFVRIISCLLIGTLLFTSCKSKKSISQGKKKTRTEKVNEKSTSDTPDKTTHTQPDNTVTIVKEPDKSASYAELVELYIENYSGIAKEEMQRYGIPASITLAQGILESGAGQGELTKKTNNHFGIKCHTEWTGEKAYHDDDELQECFRKYNDPKYSFEDHSLFLTQRSRYQDLFKLRKDDYKGWAKGLRKAGYATDPKYPEKLIRIIENNGLEKFDKEVLGTKGSIAKQEDPKTVTHAVKKGDTLYSISKKYNISVENLKKYNDLRSNDISIGQVLYLDSVKN